MSQDKKILVVEDETIVAMEIEFALQASGYNVIGKAFNSAKAIDLAKKFLPDIILMDINIKGDFNGIETATEILKFHKTAIIFVSAYSDKETKSKMSVIQPHYFLAKPYSQAELNKIIMEAISGNN
jgi:DNA-binding NarL/FixJ family response regulator